MNTIARKTVHLDQQPVVLWRIGPMALIANTSNEMGWDRLTVRLVWGGPRTRSEPVSSDLFAGPEATPADLFGEEGIA